MKLRNHCWTDGDIPDSWRIARVVLLFKKGGNSLPGNYRPTSLLPIWYKVLATVLHQQLLDGRVDEKNRPSQFGFRPKRNCMDALMIVRRLIDAAQEDNHNGLLMMFWVGRKHVIESQQV